MADDTGTTQGKDAHEFKIGELVVLSKATMSYRNGDRFGTVIKIKHGSYKSWVVVDLDRGRYGAPRSRTFEPTDLYHINKGWYGGTYDPKGK